MDKGDLLNFYKNNLFLSNWRCGGGGNIKTYKLKLCETAMTLFLGYIVYVCKFVLYMVIYLFKKSIYIYHFGGHFHFIYKQGAGDVVFFNIKC